MSSATQHGHGHARGHEQAPPGRLRRAADAVRRLVTPRSHDTRLTAATVHAHPAHGSSA